MRILAVAVGVVSVSSIASAQSLAISMGTRETGTSVGIGGNGGTNNGIEWLDLDGQTLTLDGTWQLFTFDIDAVSVTGFAGATANGVLDGDAGTLEHIRFLNNGGLTDPLQIWIDDVTDTIDSGAVNFGPFEGFSDGDEVMFQEPGFSGSTSGNLVAGSTAGVDNSVAHTGAGSYKLEFQFVDSSATRWLRLTTFNTPVLPNPAIRYDQNSVVTFMMRGVPEPASLIALGLGVSALALRRRKKATC